MVNSANYNIAISPSLQSQIKATNSIRYNQPQGNTNSPISIQDSKIKYHKIKEEDKYTVHGEWSEDYVIKVENKVLSQEENADMEKLMSRYKLIRFNLPQKRYTTYLKSCYKIDSIVSPQRFCGAGTKAIQSILEMSLADKDTQGRLVILAEITDEQTSPAGFFYKLGFRFIDKSMNEAMENWISQNTVANAPKLTGMMYLPKNNIHKLKMYNKKYL